MHELGNGGDLGEAASLDDEHFKPNFTQAALVLHNSSHIYSRKVEYLYSLVYQALNGLSAVNSEKKSSRGRSIDPELEDFREFDPYQEFLLLDDVLPTDKSDDCRHINLPPTAMDEEISRRFSMASSAGGATPRRSTSIGTQNLSASTMGRSFHGLGMSNALNQINTQSTAVLRLVEGQCDLDPSGRLLMPGCQSTPIFHAPQQPSQAPAAGAEYAPGGDFDDGDDNEDGAGFMMNDEVSAGGSEVNVHRLQVPPTASKRVTFAPEIQPPEAKPELPDAWALLDPHTADSRKSRPLRLGKTLRFPAGINDLPSECVSGSHTRKWKTAPTPTMAEQKEQKFFTTETFEVLSRKRRLEEDDSEDEDDATSEILPTVPLKGLLYGQEFAYLAREHAQRKLANRRRLRRTQQQERKNNPSTQGANNNDRDYYDDDDDGDYGGFAYGDDDDNDYDVGPVGTNGGSPMMETNTGLQAVDEVYREGNEDGKKQEVAWTCPFECIASLFLVATDADSDVDARAFESLCRAHIAKFAKGAEKYASETHLTQRVDQWQERLEPLLTEEERRPVFDIHEYGQTVLASLEQVYDQRTSKLAEDESAPTQLAGFGDVTKECPRYQVCRYFLASLSLCNTGNILLEQTYGETNKLSVKLLSTETSRPMETYMAPSAAEKATVTGSL